MNNQITKGTSKNKQHQKRVKKLDAVITTMVITGSSASKSQKISSHFGIIFTITNAKIPSTAAANSNVTKKQDG
ncbi:MAG: hypothetical protein FWE67_00625 [Planctomycetaceae bacterium]|nr:hypothetical protein [Planctomycetaceae bacterium]